MDCLRRICWYEETLLLLSSPAIVGTKPGSNPFSLYSQIQIQIQIQIQVQALLGNTVLLFSSLQLWWELNQPQMQLEKQFISWDTDNGQIHFATSTKWMKSKTHSPVVKYFRILALTQNFVSASLRDDEGCSKLVFFFSGDVDPAQSLLHFILVCLWTPLKLPSQLTLMWCLLAGSHK